MSTSQDQTPPYPPPAGPGPADAYPAWDPPTPRRRPWRQSLRAGVLVAVVIAVAGVLFGLIWHLVAPTVPVIDAGPGGIVVNDPSPEEYVAADGWFTLLGFAFGVIAAVVAWMVRRRDRGPALLLGVTIGALGAAVVAWQAGRRIGLSAYESWRETATSGATYHAPPDLHTHGVLLVPAFAAVILTTLLAGWSNDPDLDQPGAKPGYGHDLQHAYDLQHRHDLQYRHDVQQAHDLPHGQDRQHGRGLPLGGPPDQAPPAVDAPPSWARPGIAEPND